MKMKIILIVLAAFVCSISFQASAATKNIVADFKTLVEKVEKNGSEFTEKQWNRANDDFSSLVEKFKKNKEKFTNEERSQIHDYIGRYKAAVMNCDFESIKNGAVEVYNTVADAASEAFQETKSFIKGVFSKKKGKKEGE